MARGGEGWRGEARDGEGRPGMARGGQGWRGEARGGQGLPKVSTRPAMPYPSTPFRGGPPTGVARQQGQGGPPTGHIGVKWSRDFSWF
jgi:hypothetical protein